MSAAEYRHQLSVTYRGVLAVIVAILTGLSLAGPAAAEPAPEVQQAVAAARGAASCGSLRYNPTVEQAADIVNRSTYAYLDHTAENVPADDPHPTAIIKDLGINAGHVYSLQGAARNETDAIKGLLLEGRKVIPDCSYTDFGVSLLHEEQSGYILAVVVLVGT